MKPEALITLFAAFLTAGCLDPGPLVLSPGDHLPVEVENDRERPILVDLVVLEAYRGSELVVSSLDVEPGTAEKARSTRLPFGQYAIRATVGDLEREVLVTFDATTRFNRFVVQEDVIAFQSG